MNILITACQQVAVAGGLITVAGGLIAIRRVLVAIRGGLIGIRPRLIRVGQRLIYHRGSRRPAPRRAASGVETLRTAT